ncbi:hypothetical protein [Vibrio japonicus]|uniref:DUF3265 domain-containing protein n=1 Tax=Vibrio japonicus TaxID=1824638 RepID=A0ABY5LEM6_9VIBR|nr:hypothetical protein [Vibrio japonicus]UUM30449.1 hypothetical protein NP165_12305 [Vibrio japonicus]
MKKHSHQYCSGMTYLPSNRQQTHAKFGCDTNVFVLRYALSMALIEHDTLAVM